MDVGKITAEVRADLSKFDSDLNQAKSTATSAASDIESKFRGVGSAIGSAVKTGVAAAAVAFAGVATAGVKSYMDIESAAADAASKMDLSAIAQKSGTTTAAAFANVKEHVMSLADELGQLNTNAFDPTQIAQACANLAAQGFDVATASAEDLAPVLTLATAANYDLADSADMAMSTMNTFGMGVESLGHIADVYTTACGASAAGMGDLNYAMQQAGPVASVANISFETLTACLETFSQSNIKGEKAGTALRGAINTLITPTKSLTDGLASIGLSMDQVDPRSNDFVDVLAKMKTQADASGQGLSAFTSIFGAEGGLIYKLASSTDQIETFRNGLLDCDGAAEQMAKNMLDNLGGSMDAAMGAASSLAYKIGGDLAPTLKATFDWFSASGAPAIREFITAIEQGDWEKVGDLLSNAVKAGWAKVKSTAGQLVSALKGVNWGAIGQYLYDGVKAGWDELKGLGEDLLSSLSSVNWSGVGTSILSAISSAIDSVIDYAGGIYDYFTDIDWSGVWDSLVSAWDSAIDTLSDVGSTILGYFDSIDWGTVGFKIGQAIRDAIAKLSDIGTTIWNYLTSTDWSGAGSSITEKIRSGLETLKDYWEEFRAGFLAVDWATTASDIATKLKDGFKKVTDWASSIIDGIKKDWSAWVSSGGPANLGTDLAKAVLKGASDLGKWIYDAVANWWRSNGSSLGGVISNAIDFAKLALRTAYDFVTGFANTILTAGKGTIGAAILEIIGGTMNSAWDGAGDSLIEKAAGWREEAESIFSGEDFDVDVATTYTGAGNPKDLDGSTIAVNVQYTATSGKSLAPDMSAEGGASIAAKGDKLYVSLAGSPEWMEATEWAKEMGKAGNTTTDFLEIINGMKTAGTKLLPSTIEKLTAAFTEGQAEYNASQTRANAATVAAATEAASIETEGAKAETATETSSIRDIMAEAKSTSSGVMKSIMDTATAASSAMSSAAEKILSGSQTAANAIALGGQVASNFTTQAGQAVQIGLSSSGREIAVIGSVAQQNVTAAGGELYSKVTVAGSNLVASSNQAASIGIAAENQKATTSQGAGTTWLSNVTTSGNTITGAATTFKTGIDTATTGFVTGVGTAAGALVSTVGSVAASLLGGKLSIGGTASSGSSTNTFTDCFFEGFTDSCTNMNVNALKYTSPGGVVSYINPLTYHSTGGTTGNSGNTGYQLPAIFRAKGGLIDDGPELAIIGESGSEMVLPHDITQTILDLTRGGVEGNSSGGANTITPSDVYLDGRKVGQIAFKYGTESMRRKGMSIR